MKRLALLLIPLLCSVHLLAQPKATVKQDDAAKQKQWKAAVKTAAKKMDDALVKKDLKNFVKTTYPKVLESTEGGEEKLVKDLESQLAGMEAQKNKIISAWPGEASNMIDTAGELQCTIPQYMKIQLDNGVLTTQTTLMGLSPDEGKTWYFIDATDKPIESWRKVFPNLSSRLSLKPPPEPKFQPKKGL